jgi:hypothetical protein
MRSDYDNGTFCGDRRILLLTLLLAPLFLIVGLFTSDEQDGAA